MLGVIFEIHTMMFYVYRDEIGSKVFGVSNSISGFKESLLLLFRLEGDTKRIKYIIK